MPTKETCSPKYMQPELCVLFPSLLPLLRESRCSNLLASTPILSIVENVKRTIVEKLRTNKNRRRFFLEDNFYFIVLSNLKNAIFHFRQPYKQLFATYWDRNLYAKCLWPFIVCFVLKEISFTIEGYTLNDSLIKGRLKRVRPCNSRKTIEQEMNKRTLFLTVVAMWLFSQAFKSYKHNLSWAR